jgi:colicin import membrane protein
MNAITYPETVALARPDPVLIQSADQYLLTARQCYASIATTDECEAAGEDLKGIKAAQKRLEDARTTITKPLLEAQRAVNALFKTPQETLSEAERIVKQGILTYQAAEERKRREAEAVAAEAARKEREKLEAQAARAAAAGKTEKAEALNATAAAIPERVVLPSSAPKISGMATKTVWRAELTDKQALVKYVAEHPEWLSLVDINTAALNSMARTQKGAMALPGVKAIEEKQLASRAA